MRGLLLCGKSVFNRVVVKDHRTLRCWLIRTLPVNCAVSTLASKSAASLEMRRRSQWLARYPWSQAWGVYIYICI
jgi:hypothetical protein